MRQLALSPSPRALVQALATIFLLSACSGPRPCLEGCEEDRPFWEACMDSTGALCDGAISADCVDDPATYADCLASGFEGEACNTNTLLEEGVFHFCEDADDAVESCQGEVTHEFSELSAEERGEAREECEQASADTGLAAAMADADCEAFCAVLLGDSTAR